MVGDGDERAAVEALVRELGVEDRCRLAGYQQGLADWYAGFDALCLTSVNEGTPVAAIEALAARRPVVATRVGGVPAVVADGEDGYLVASGDTEALAGRLAELAGDPELRERMGSRGAERMRELYSVERMVERIEASLHEAAVVRVLHVHKLRGVGGSENHLLALLPGPPRARRRRPLPRARRPRSRRARLLRGARPARRPVPPAPLRRGREPAHGP